MRLAFVTAALSAALAAGALAALVIWVVTVVTESAAPWSIAPPIVGLTAVAFGVATYLAERIAYRRSLARMRGLGEPWAFRDDGR